MAHESHAAAHKEIHENPAAVPACLTLRLSTVVPFTSRVARDRYAGAGGRRQQSSFNWGVTVVCLLALMERGAASRWTGRAVLPITRVARRPARSRYAELSNAYATAETESRRGKNRRNARDCTDLQSTRAPDRTRVPIPIGSQLSVISDEPGHDCSNRRRGNPGAGDASSSKRHCVTPNVRHLAS